MPTLGFRFLNSANQPVDDLHVTWTGTGGQLTNLVITEGPAGASTMTPPPPAMPNGVDIVYNAPVPPGGTSGFTVDSQFPNIAVVAAVWTRGGDPVGPAQVIFAGPVPPVVPVPPADVLPGFDQLSAWAKTGFPVGTPTPNLQAEATAALNGELANAVLAWTTAQAAADGLSADVVTAVFNNVRQTLTRKAAAGQAFELTDLEGASLCWAVTSHNIGNLLVPPNGAIILGQQAGALFEVKGDGGGAIDPKSSVGKAILILDMLIEILGALLLFLNIVLPKFNWAGAIETLGGKKTLTALDNVAALIAVLGKLISEDAPMEQILKAALKILEAAWGGEIWETLKKGFDMSWADWIELICKLILLSALEAGADSVSAGFATAAKITLVVATLADLFLKKAPKLEGA